MRPLCLSALACLATWATWAASLATADTPKRVSFNREIRPILSDNCFQCHGPDKNQRKADLRLDVEEGLVVDRGGYQVLTPGKPAESELYRRITAEKATERMPLAKSGKQLTRQQIDTIRLWIEQGAKWEPHWAFLPPISPPIPALRSGTSPPNPPLRSGEGGKGGDVWPRNPIDHFVLERLQREGLSPSPEADKTTLIRRVTLDLTGLPPTPAEVDAFLGDDSPDAYEKVVDRLLASPRFGERMARPWLDAARYADSNGYQSDGERFMWRWRDWVIDAFNKTMPFDQFTIEQLAGDMLPNATLEQKIATGFNRNHRGNGEGGIIPEEYAVEYVVDRVETTATVWLGLTVGCARCHDHKFDPIAQKEFYQFFAYFNNVPEKGRANKFGNSPPMIKAPTREQEKQLRELEDRLAQAEKRFAELEPRLQAAQEEWEKAIRPEPVTDWTVSNGLAARFGLDEPKDEGATAKLKFVDGEPAFKPGRLGQAAAFDGKRHLDAGDMAKFGFYDKFSFTAWVFPEGDQGGAILSRMVDKPEGEGYSLVLKDGKLQLNLVKRWLDDALRVETAERLAPNQWHHLVATYDGSRLAEGVRLCINGQPAKLSVLLDELNQSFETKEPFRIGAGGGPEARFHGLIDEVRVYRDVLDVEEVQVLAAAETVGAIAGLPPAKRTAAQAAKLHAYFRDNVAPQPIRDAWRQLLALRKEKARFVESIPTVMVMEELPTPRDAFVLVRGAYDKPGEKVTPGVPLLASKQWHTGAEPKNRLEFARWLVQPSNPLTARVTVNRFWQMYFGTGLVKTTEDFGVQGEPPSHPELLDWLATEFVNPSHQPSLPKNGQDKRSGWDVKAMQKLIVTSAAYRQSSRATPSLLQRDPDNRLLARGPRLRLPAETIRDQALAISGLLVEKLGGPSVKPYQPPGLWKELTGTEDYEQDHGEKLYRRSLYTFWKRTAPPPVMVNFDAAGRETCIVRETRTNTPLQALNLLNDVTYVEAARVLAQRIMTEGGRTPQERIIFAFRLAAARQPKPAELKILLGGFERHLAEYRQNPQAALKLVSAGEYPRNENLDVGELAAYTAVGQLILNLDEVITKE